MAHSLSAKKRVRQDAKKRILNRSRKSAIKTLTKRFLNALDESNLEKAQQELLTLTKKLDKMACTSTMHKNTTSRVKSRMTKRLNALKTKGSATATA